MLLKNFDKFDSQPYGEVGQTNPIRWMNLRPIKGGYECVSHWWKCKDFLNDVITAYHVKKSFSIYGFKVDPSVFFSEGQTTLPMLVKNLYPAFFDNIKVINNFVNSLGMPSVSVVPYTEKEGTALVDIPNEYLQSTLFISTITLFIRLANTNSVYTSLDEMVKDVDNRGDSANYNATKQKPMNKFSEKLTPFVWWYDDVYNCPKDGSKTSFSTSMMHNCGVVQHGWI